MQGWRVRMEDAHVAEVALGDPEQRLSLFGVFDGHVSSFVESRGGSMWWMWLWSLSF